GMVMKPEPFFEAVESLGAGAPIVLMSARGRTFTHADAVRFAGGEELTLLCGHYKDVDQRVADFLATEEISLGDFVLSGGEPAALAIIDATVRLLPGGMSDLDGARGRAVGRPAARAPAPGLALPGPQPKRAATLIVRVHPRRRARPVGVELGAGERVDAERFREIGRRHELRRASRLRGGRSVVERSIEIDRHEAIRRALRAGVAVEKGETLTLLAARHERLPSEGHQAGHSPRHQIHQRRALVAAHDAVGKEVASLA